MVVAVDRNNNFSSPSSIAMKKKSSLTDTPRPFVTREGVSVSTITPSTSPPTKSPISNIPSSPTYPNHISPTLTTTNNFLQPRQLLNTSKCLDYDSGTFSSSSFSTRKSSDVSNRSRVDSGISTDCATTGLSPSMSYLQNEHYDETKRPFLSSNKCSESLKDDQCKLRERSNAFSKPHSSTSEHISITICVTGNDFICELDPSRNVGGASLDKDNEIEDFKQSSKG